MTEKSEHESYLHNEAKQLLAIRKEATRLKTITCDIKAAIYIIIAQLS